MSVVIGRNEPLPPRRAVIVCKDDPLLSRRAIAAAVATRRGTNKVVIAEERSPVGENRQQQQRGRDGRVRFLPSVSASAVSDDLAGCE